VVLIYTVFEVIAGVLSVAITLVIAIKTNAFIRYGNVVSFISDLYNLYSEGQNYSKRASLYVGLTIRNLLKSALLFILEITILAIFDVIGVLIVVIILLAILILAILLSKKRSLSFKDFMLYPKTKMDKYKTDFSRDPGFHLFLLMWNAIIPVIGVVSITNYFQLGPFLLGYGFFILAPIAISLLFSSFPLFKYDSLQVANLILNKMQMEAILWLKYASTAETLKIHVSSIQIEKRLKVLINDEVKGRRVVAFVKWKSISQVEFILPGSVKN
jgi:hypothetical protein